MGITKEYPTIVFAHILGEKQRWTEKYNCLGFFGTLK